MRLVQPLGGTIIQHVPIRQGRRATVCPTASESCGLPWPPSQEVLWRKKREWKWIKNKKKENSQNSILKSNMPRERRKKFFPCSCPGAASGKSRWVVKSWTLQRKMRFTKRCLSINGIATYMISSVSLYLKISNCSPEITVFSGTSAMMDPCTQTYYAQGSPITQERPKLGQHDRHAKGVRKLWQQFMVIINLPRSPMPRTASISLSTAPHTWQTAGEIMGSMSHVGSPSQGLRVAMRHPQLSRRSCQGSRATQTNASRSWGWVETLAESRCVDGKWWLIMAND